MSSTVFNKQELVDLLASEDSVIVSVSDVSEGEGLVDELMKFGLASAESTVIRKITIKFVNYEVVKFEDTQVEEEPEITVSDDEEPQVH